jgi:phosphoenolpyruvate carboxykinase (GTP)
MSSRTDAVKLPQIYYVNWFRQDAQGKFLWPGYGENCRVLKWIFERVNGEADAIDTPIGRLPVPGALELSGLKISQQAIDELLKVDIDGWRAEVPLIKQHFEMFGDRLPRELHSELSRLEDRLNNAMP